LHPILFAAFPVLFIFSRNVAGFPVRDMVRPLAIAVGVAAAAWAILSVLLRNARKAALIVSLAAVLFSSFGHLRSQLEFLKFAFGFNYAAETLLIVPVALIFAVGAYFAVRTKSGLVNLTRILNASSAFLVVFCTVQISGYLYRSRHARRFKTRHAPVAVTRVSPEERARLPNIFYIILDGYGRSDNLLELFGHDNTPFIEGLKSRGFYVASGARANYSHTSLSLSSSLNMEYLDALVEWVGPLETSQEPLRESIAHSRARRFLADRGYSFLCFASGYFATEIKAAELYLAPDSLGEFERGLLATTAVATPRRQRAKDQARIRFMLERLPETADSEVAFFVLAHIVAPHPPFVFNRDGGDTGDERYFFLSSANHLIREGKLTRSQYIERYVEQTVFIENAITRCIDEIVESARVPPIIVVQGDHGSGAFLHHDSLERTYLRDRMCILNAYYLPGGAAADLYDSITPVNTFRVIFNRYFGAELPLLEDRSFYATAGQPYDFTEVTDRIGDGEDRARLEALKSADYYPGRIESGAGVPDAKP
ncbi:MAG: hypothetical protein ACYTAN_05560, partial [Planctomycetota bacterium]